MMRIFKKGLFEVFVLAMLWGPSFLFIKIAEGDITPLTLVALRISIGALLLYGVLKFKQIRLPYDPILWGHCFILGFFANSFPFICFNYAVMSIPTSLSALINGTTPILTILLANLFLKDEPLTWNRSMGVMISLSGFFVLFLPAILGFSMELEIKGMLLSFLAASSYAVGMVYARRYIQNAPPLVVPMMQLSTSLFYLIPLAFIVDSPIQLIQEASLSAWAGVFGLSLLGTTLAFMMYHRILVRQGATALSMVTYLLPIIGTIIGVMVLHEEVGMHFVIAATLILCGVMVVNGVVSLPRLIPKRI